MGTGACGINCDVCRLNLLGICTTCGPGKSPEGVQKCQAQEHLLGAPCPVLACAVMKGVDFCLRDCTNFPCENFTVGPYPFSDGFLKMQTRRRQSPAPARDPNGRPIDIPEEYWHEIQKKDRLALCNMTLAEPDGDGDIVFSSLNRTLRIERENKRICRRQGDDWIPIQDKQLELLTLLYFNRVRRIHPLGRDMVAAHDLREAHYFKGRHALPLAPLLARFENDSAGFREAAEFLGGAPVDMADAAYRLHPFPRVPLVFLFWRGDDTFEAKFSVLFDRSIQETLSASAIWSLVQWVALALVRGPGPLEINGADQTYRFVTDPY